LRIQPQSPQRALVASDVGRQPLALPVGFEQPLDDRGETLPGIGRQAGRDRQPSAPFAMLPQLAPIG